MVQNWKTRSVSALWVIFWLCVLSLFETFFFIQKESVFLARCIVFGGAIGFLSLLILYLKQQRVVRLELTNFEDHKVLLAIRIKGESAYRLITKNGELVCLIDDLMETREYLSLHSYTSYYFHEDALDTQGVLVFIWLPSVTDPKRFHKPPLISGAFEA